MKKYEDDGKTLNQMYKSHDNVWIIGNGFDLACKLNTKFWAFIDFYLFQDTNDPDISLFKKRIKENKEEWYDVERQLGQDTVNFDTIEIYEKCHNDLKTHLYDYIRKGEADSNPTYSDVDKYFEDIDIDNTLFIVLNYTQNFENFIKQKYPNTQPQIVYPHGSIVSGNITVGIGGRPVTSENIKNLKFLDDEEFHAKFVKESMSSYVDEIKSLDFDIPKNINIYGASISLNDGFYGL